MTKRHLLRILEREREAHAAERTRLVDTICRLAGKPNPEPQRFSWDDLKAEAARETDDDLIPV